MASEQVALLTQMRARKSAEERFEELYQRERDSAWVYALSIVGDSQTAEDVVAAVFEKLWRRRALIRFGAGEKTYLTRSIRNAAIDELRRRGRDAVPTEVLPETGEDPALAERAAQTEQIRALLWEIPASDRELLVLRYWLDLDNSQIGDLCGLSQTNVATRISRILARLRLRCDAEESRSVQ